MATTHSARANILQRGSYYVTAKLAERALALTAPMIEKAQSDASIVGSGFLYVVVMDPSLLPDMVSFEEAILYERAFGDRSRWDADYARFARDKARLSWRTGRDGRALQQDLPHLLRPGDSGLIGGICIDGLVVAASGALPVFDEVFAGTAAMWIRALARDARAADTSQPNL